MRRVDTRRVVTQMHDLLLAWNGPVMQHPRDAMSVDFGPGPQGAITVGMTPTAPDPAPARFGRPLIKPTPQTRQIASLTARLRTVPPRLPPQQPDADHGSADSTAQIRVMGCGRAGYRTKPAIGSPLNVRGKRDEGGAAPPTLSRHEAITVRAETCDQAARSAT